MLEYPGPLDLMNNGMTTADRRQIFVHGSTELSVCFCGCKLPLQVTVVDMQPEAVLGMDALCHWKASVNTSRGEIDVEDGTNVEGNKPAACLRVMFCHPFEECLTSTTGKKRSSVQKDMVGDKAQVVQDAEKGPAVNYQCPVDHGLDFKVEQDKTSDVPRTTVEDTERKATVSPGGTSKQDQSKEVGASISEQGFIDASYDGLRVSALEEDWVQGPVRGKVIGIKGDSAVDNEVYSKVGTREFQAELETD